MPKRNLIWAAIAILAAAAVLTITRSRPLSTAIDPQDETFAPLVRIHELAKRHYYDTVPPGAATAAIRSYLRELDPYCRYVPPDRQDDLDRLIAGQRVGIGLHYAIEQGRVKVLGAMRNSPSMKAGLRGGDVLLAIDGEAATQPTREWVDNRLTGEKGTSVTLRIAHAEGGESTIPVPRQVYDVDSATGLYCRRDGQWQYWLDQPRGIAYVRINEFISGTAGELEKVLRPLQREGVQALVLDLRDNPGGPLTEAIDVADLFLNEGLIVVTKGLHSRTERHMAQRDRTLPNFPVVLLINRGTISAPEIVAGALKRHRRALLLGGRTYGKDYIQSVFDLGGHLGTVTLTTARYFFTDLPAATQPTATASAAASEPSEPPGIAPDITLELSPAEQAELQRLRYETGVPPPPVAATQPVVLTADEDLSKFLSRDRQLAKALHLLRSDGAVEAILAEEAPATRPTTRPAK